MTLLDHLADLERRRENMWAAASAFLANRDSHGVMDMGAEIQALDRAITELRALGTQKST